MKRLFDIVVALTALLVLSPVIMLLALAVVITMGRPVLFLQPRCGRGGLVFRVIKFRTMRAEAFVGESDAARTPAVGRLLRESSLDELPQFWNILRGQMSLIGPRPTVPEQVARYSDRERGRLAVRPGLTGWAQINGRNGISWPERIELDLWYLQHRSCAVDLKILARTVLAVLGRRDVVGAGGVNPDFHPLCADGIAFLPGPRLEVDLPHSAGRMTADGSS